MSENSEVIKKFQCNICVKFYSSQSSLCNHNKKFHSCNSVVKCCTNVVNCCSNVVDCCSNNIKNTKKTYKCDFCKRIFNDRSNKFNHVKICKHKIQIINNNNNKLEKIEKENTEIKNILKQLLEKNCKIHPKTLQKINKQLINNNTNSNNTINSTNTINNGPIINNTYVKFGNERLSSLLSHKDMLKIINKQCLCIEESIKSVISIKIYQNIIMYL